MKKLISVCFLFGSVEYLYILADALKRAKSTDSVKLRDALAQTKDFYGVTGKINFDASRDAIKPVVILKLAPKNSKFFIIRQISLKRQTN